MYVNFLAVSASVLNHDVATMSLSALVDAFKTSLLLSLGSITFNPTVWNIVARNGRSCVFSALLELSPRVLAAKEYRNKTITHIFGGNPHLGCYFLAACIFSAGILRDHLYVVVCVVLSFHLSPCSPFLLLSVPDLGQSLTHTRYIHTQLPERDPRTAAGAHPPRSARHARPRRALRRRADLRRDLDLDARHHGHVPGRLFRHSHGLSC